MTESIRQGSAPNFCPPEEEGLVLSFEDEEGNLVNLEFLGLLLYPENAPAEEQARYGFFYPVDDEEVGESGEVLCLEVTELDEEGQPASFAPLYDDELTQEIYKAFMRATKDLYRFA